MKYSNASDKMPAKTGKRSWITIMSIILILLAALAIGISRTVI